MILSGAVVPYRGTWVETGDAIYVDPFGKSYLIEVRGLKHGCWFLRTRNDMSYLIEVYGLKRENTCVRSIIRSHPLGVRHGNIWN